MEDKWLIYMLEEQLFFHRSWTGLPAFRLAFSADSENHDVVKAVWSNDVLEGSDPEYQVQLLVFYWATCYSGRLSCFHAATALMSRCPACFNTPSRVVARKPWWRFWR